MSGMGISMAPGARGNAHDILPWYDYDEVSKIEIRQGGRRVERFAGYETEEDVKQALRDLGMHGTFEVVGMDVDGEWMPHRGEITVSPKRAPLDNFLRTKYFKAESSGRSNGTQVETERDLLAFQAQERRRMEEEVEERRRRLEEKQEELLQKQEAQRDELIAEQMRLQEQRHRVQSEAQQKILEEKERTLKESLERITNSMHERQNQQEQMSRNTLETMSRLFEDKSATVTTMAESSQAIMTQMFNTQMDVLRREVDAWKAKADELQRETLRREEMAKEREERLRETYEGKMENIVNRHENEIERLRDKIEMQVNSLKSDAARDVARLEDKYLAQVRTLEEKLREADRAREEAKDRARALEIELIRSGFEFKVAETELRAQHSAGPSEHVRDTAELMKVAKEIGVDPGLVFKREMGYDDEPPPPPEEKKEGLAATIFKEIGPALTEGLKNQLINGTSQAKPALANTEISAGGSSPLGLPSEEF